MRDALPEARIRAERFSFRDGIQEIALGVIILLSIGGNSVIHSGYLPGIFIYLLVIFSFASYARPLIDAVRARITYPRSGYVQAFTPRGRILTKVVLPVLAAITLMVVVRYVRRAGCPNFADWVQWVPVLVGLGFGAMWIYTAMRYGLRRFLVVGIFLMILGVAASIEYPWMLALTILIAGFGGANLCSGGLTLLSYLRNTPPAAKDS